MRFNRDVLLVGPASVGKTTVGPLVAERLDTDFVDIDERFTSIYGDIVEFIKAHNERTYVETNSQLVDAMLAKALPGTVYAAPAGFLVHDRTPDLNERHRRLIARRGIITVSLLPSENPEQTADMIAQRQIERWPEATFEQERAKYIGRHALYSDLADVRVVGTSSPADTADSIVEKVHVSDPA